MLEMEVETLTDYTEWLSFTETIMNYFSICKMF